MLTAVSGFSSFSVDDAEEAKEFYGDTLGLQLTDDSMGLHIELPGGSKVFVYEKDDHVPAEFTVLNFVVENIDAAVESLTEQGIKFEIYDTMPVAQDDKGILRGKAALQGPDIAWFKDFAGNIVAVMEE